ncbi:hypothetical protein B0H14DRAFT_1387182 [Mycena olivaceomarginata]|nr:hypothetical protein B0H14DRAFT_1387182 [Mycena olivaceomarginata]
MVDAEKGLASPRKGDDPSEEATAAKLWAVYISEAEKYDKALVESWKSDMEGMLIFAGLFSASLTAFLIESYKTLNPDSGDMTITLLSQISQQLAASANGTPFQIPAPARFTPAPSSLVCNALWFISLGFSLSCALIATLLEQWARDFLHKADMRSAPIIRARVFSYLYYGLKRFNMHTVVEIIPLLLHASLLFFFGGLVAFLIPVNLTMTIITAILLLILVAVYSVLTLLPLWYMDSPYRTPLSGAFWRLLQGFQTLQKHHYVIKDGDLSVPATPRDESMVEIMFHAATKISDEQRARDRRALVWTVKSLADDTELEPFVEAIPDVLWGVTMRQEAYGDHILHLVKNPEVDLFTRILLLLQSCKSGILPPPVCIQRRITCYKALWAIASLSRPSQSPADLPLPVELGGFERVLNEWVYWESDPETDGYILSTWKMMEWSAFCSARGPLIRNQKYLMICADQVKNGQNPDLNPVISFVRKYECLCSYPGDLSAPVTSLIPQLTEFLDTFLSNTPYRILAGYLSSSTELSSPPYRWTETQEIITVDPSVAFSNVRKVIEGSLDQIILAQLKKSNSSPENKIHWFNSSISRLLLLWKPLPDDDTNIPYTMIRLLNEWESDFELEVILGRGEIEGYLWSNFPLNLTAEPSARGEYQKGPSQERSLTALWRLASLQFWEVQPLNLLDSVLDTVRQTDTLFTHISSSIIPLLKFNILVTMSRTSLKTMGELRASLQHQIFPADTDIHIADELPPQQHDGGSDSPTALVTGYLHQRMVEAKVDCLVKFLEHCSTDILPYKAVETLRKIAQIKPVGRIHRAHQNRFANSLHSVFTAGSLPELLNTIMESSCWDIYAAYPEKPDNGDWTLPQPLVPWLDDPDSRRKICAVFTEYKKKLADTLIRVRKILEGLEFWHPDSGVPHLEAGGTGEPVEGVGPGTVVNQDSPALGSATLHAADKRDEGGVREPSTGAQ